MNKSDSRIPSALRAQVLRRDGTKCIAPLLDRQAGWCKDRWDHLITRWPKSDPGGDMLELHHVKDKDKQMTGKKAPTDADHLVPLCPWHHRGMAAGSCWATKRENLALIRAYLGRVR